jgi:hypothetical protein
MQQPSLNTTPELVGHLQQAQELKLGLKLGMMLSPIPYHF